MSAANTPGAGAWLTRKVSKLLPGVVTASKAVRLKDNEEKVPEVPAVIDKFAIKSGATESATSTQPSQQSDKLSTKPAAAIPKSTLRSLAERLKGSLRRPEEALSPRLLRRALDDLKAIVDGQVSEVEGGKRAQVLAQWYASAKPQERRDLWLLMSEQFVANPEVVKVAQAHMAAAVGTPHEAAAEVHFRRATVSPRRRLLQRFSAFPEGIRFLVDLRADLLPHLKSDGRLAALDVEMEYMFSTWFDVGFLDLRRISWHSPASLIEKLIKYEAVHDIKSWADVKNRLDSDRRCYGFFHPRLPDEPLIFVEVALVDALANSVTPLLDEAASASDLKKATIAIFYSISNTQQGLRGVSFGDSLIKRVVEELKGEFPKLRVFATLSPIPGFRPWLAKNAAAMLAKLDDKSRAALGRALGFEPPGPEHLLTAADKALTLDAKSPVRHMVLQCAAHYLGTAMQDGKPLDPVARFHLGNGARVERLNWAGDPSAKGVKQSYGVMVNYLYDLKRLDRHRLLLAQGKIATSTDIDDLLF
jgi:malonyl-CoA decarboxylase